MAMTMMKTQQRNKQQQVQHQQRELIVNYQFRDRNRVLQLQRSKHKRRPAVTNTGSNCSSAGTSSILASSCCCSAVMVNETQELSISQARLSHVDFEWLVQFLRSSQRTSYNRANNKNNRCDKRHIIQTITIKACLLERIDAIVPLLEYCNSSPNKDYCCVESICFTAVEVLVEKDDEEELTSTTAESTAASTQGCTSHHYKFRSSSASNNLQPYQIKQQPPTLERAHSCMVRPLLKLLSSFPQKVPPHNNNKGGVGGMYKLTLRNVDLAGAQDGLLLARALMFGFGALEMYQSGLGPLGSQQVCQHSMTMATVQQRCSTAQQERNKGSDNKNDECCSQQQCQHQDSSHNGHGLEELCLGYCSLDDLGVASLVRQMVHPASTVCKLELYRNRSPPAVILDLLADVLKHPASSLRDLGFSDSPFLFSSRYFLRRPPPHNLDDWPRILPQEQPEQQQQRGNYHEDNGDEDSHAIQAFLHALNANRSLASLKIVCCGLQSVLIGPLAQALATRGQVVLCGGGGYAKSLHVVEGVVPLLSLRLRGSRLEEPGLVTVTSFLAQLSQLQTLEIFCSADGLTLQSMRQFVQTAQQHALHLVEFEGSGWLDLAGQELMHRIVTRNMLMKQLQQSFFFLTPYYNMGSDNCENLIKGPSNQVTACIGLHHGNNVNDNGDTMSAAFMLGLWPHALARLLSPETPQPLLSQQEEQQSSPCGLAAAFLMLQAGHAQISFFHQQTTKQHGSRQRDP